ncbi:hypothetical protein HK100_007084 [Physocladia obscura]|uniref:C2H2-type domain-containing protein n=1 Tax=Physocladia obscura TaxID=109957 RepID=A0AAD5T7M1_9FUNG|nr:hypothetical protein HK100_007084 [Physocladia obscura]
MSEAMLGPADSLPPSRLECILSALETFTQEFLVVNPLGSIGLIETRDGGAEKLTEMTGNGNEHVAAIKAKPNREPRGEPSLQNSLEIARRSLLHVPSHGSREILILYSALNTCDPGNIFETIEALKTDNIRVSIIGLAAEMQICKRICKETKGVYNVILNEMHLKEVLAEHVAPPVVESEIDTGLAMIEMGFPSSIVFDIPTLCANHQKRTQTGYECPRCKTTICELPTDCPVCSLTLVSSVLLARSYHHLFPVPTYKEVPLAATYSSLNCRACSMPFPVITAEESVTNTREAVDNLAPKKASILGSGTSTQGLAASSSRYQCVKCKEYFCLECDLYAHETLHNCVGCLGKI